MSYTIERRTIGERYVDAVSTSDLGCGGGRYSTDADVLLAAGFAAAGDTAGALGLLLWRMRETRDLRGFGGLAETSADWLIGRPAGRTRLARRMRRIEAVDLASVVLCWWLDNTCPTCQGRAHPLTRGTRRIDSSRECSDCRGTGIAPVEPLVVRHEHREHARWLADRYDAMAGRIFGAMAKRLAPMLDLDVANKTATA